MGSTVVGDPVNWTRSYIYAKARNYAPTISVVDSGAVSVIGKSEGYAFWSNDNVVRLSSGVFSLDGRVNDNPNEWEFGDNPIPGTGFLFTSSDQNLGTQPYGYPTNSFLMYYTSGGRVPGKRIFSGNSTSSTTASIRSPYLVGTMKIKTVPPPWVEASGLSFAPEINVSSLRFASSSVCKMRDGRIAHVGVGSDKLFGAGYWASGLTTYNYAGTPTYLGNDAGSVSSFHHSTGSATLWINNVDPIETLIDDPAYGSFCNDAEPRISKLATDGFPGASAALSSKNKHAGDIHVVIYSSNGITVQSDTIYVDPLDSWDGTSLGPAQYVSACFYYIDDNNVCVANGSFRNQSNNYIAFRVVLNLQTMTMTRITSSYPDPGYVKILDTYSARPIETSIVDIGSGKSILFNNWGASYFDRSIGVIGDYAEYGSILFGPFSGAGIVDGSDGSTIERSNSILEDMSNDRFIIWNSFVIKNKFSAVDAKKSWNPGGRYKKECDILTIPRDQRGRWVNRSTFKAHPLYNNSTVNVFDFSFIKSIKNQDPSPSISSPDAFYVIPMKKFDPNQYGVSKFFAIDVSISESGPYVFGAIYQPCLTHSYLGFGLRLYKYENPSENKIVKRVIPGDGFSNLDIVLTRISAYLDTGKYCLVVTRFESKFGYTQDLDPGRRELWNEIDLENPPANQLVDLNALPDLAILEFGRVRT